MLLSPHLAKVSFPLFFFHHAADCNPGKSADLGSSFQKPLIKVHHAVSIVKPPGISLWIRGDWGRGGALLNCLSAAEKQAFIWNVLSWKWIGLRSQPIGFSKSHGQIGEDKDGAASCPHLQETSGIEGDKHEIAASGLQKINGLISPSCVLWLSRRVHPQNLMTTWDQPARMLQQTEINSRLP